MIILENMWKYSRYQLIPHVNVEILVEEALCFCLSYQNGELVRTHEEHIITSSINFAAVYACTKYSIHFFNARVPLGLCQINISIWAWHQDSILYPVGGGEYLNL